MWIIVFHDSPVMSWFPVSQVVKLGWFGGFGVSNFDHSPLLGVPPRCNAGFSRATRRICCESPRGGLGNYTCYSKQFAGSHVWNVMGSVRGELLEGLVTTWLTRAQLIVPIAGVASISIYPGSSNYGSFFSFTLGLSYFILWKASFGAGRWWSPFRSKGLSLKFGAPKSAVPSGLFPDEVTTHKGKHCWSLGRWRCDR